MIQEANLPKGMVPPNRVTEASEKKPAPSVARRAREPVGWPSRVKIPI